jgi:hypothetical protein
MGARHGSILLSNTFKDPRYIRQEAARIKAWLAGMPAGKAEAAGKGKSREGNAARKASKARKGRKQA